MPWAQAVKGAGMLPKQLTGHQQLALSTKKSKPHSLSLHGFSAASGRGGAGDLIAVYTVHFVQGLYRDKPRVMLVEEV